MLSKLIFFAIYLEDKEKRCIFAVELRNKVYNLKRNNMWGIYYKVNGKGQYKNYMDGTYTEMKKASDDLISRATEKGFKMIKRAQGSGGVNLTYSDGKTRVEIVYVETERDREWLAFFDKCQAEREAKAA